MATTIIVESLIQGNQILHDQMVTFSNEKIISVKSSVGKALKGTLVPGFIDVQVNGGGGALFNLTPSLDCIKTIGVAHQQFGTTGWLPTLITDSIEQMRQGANAVAEAINEKVPGVLGIHFEGPHLAVAKKGVHKEQLIRSLSSEEMEIFSRKDLGKVVVTLAPENVSLENIEQLVAENVTVCLGHSNASFEQTNNALEAGAIGFTHLYNAMSAMNSREPGMVGAALLAKDSYSGLILDGVHVHPKSAEIAMNSQTSIMLVTDAMPPVGSSKNSFEFFGQTISRIDNTLRDNKGSLAGSVLDMAKAVDNAVTLVGKTIQEATTMASLNPAKFLQLDNVYGTLDVGKKANMVLLNEEGKVTASWIEGELVFGSL